MYAQYCQILNKIIFQVFDEVHPTVIGATNLLVWTARQFPPFLGSLSELKINL